MRRERGNAGVIDGGVVGLIATATLILVVIICFSLSNFRPPVEKSIPVTATQPQLELNPRFSVESYGFFKSEYGYEQRREIFVIKDNVNHTEMIGITGVGISQPMRSGKSTKEE